METLVEASLIDFVVRAQQGDQAAFNELVRQFESTVFATALRRLRNTTEASELVQDVFLQVFRKLPQLREPERFAGWLKRITIRMAINRAVRQPPVLAQDPQTFGGVAARGETPLEHLLDGEQAGLVRIGIQQLGKMDRETLVAFYFEGQSLIEMSAQFRSPVGTIKRRLHTARSRLRDVLTVDAQV